MTTTITFSSAAASTGWTNPENALAGPNAQSAYVSGPGSLVLTGPSSGVPAGESILGMEVRMLAGFAGGPVGQPVPPAETEVIGSPPSPSVDVALTIDGATPVGEWRRTAPLPNFLTETSVGGPADLMGWAWLPIDVGAGFGVLIRFSTGAGEGGGVRLVDLAYVVVTHAPAGGQTMVNQERNIALQQTIITREITGGAPATANPVRLRSVSVDLKPVIAKEVFEADGDLLPTAAPVVTDSSSLNIDGKICLNEFGYFLASMIGRPTTILVAAAAGNLPAVYRHTFDFNPRGVQDRATYQVEKGDGIKIGRANFGLLNTLSVGLDGKTAGKLSGAGFARRYDETATAFVAGANDIQTVAITGAPTGGTFRLEYMGAETGDLAFGITSAALQTALQGLSTVGAGNLLVTGAGPFTVTGAGALGGRALPLLGVTRSNLTGGASPGVTVTHTSAGGYRETDIVAVAGGMTAHYYASTLAGVFLETAKLGRANSAANALERATGQFYAMDPANALGFAATSEGMAKLETALSVEADTVGLAMLADARLDARRYYRQRFDGPVIQGTEKYSYEYTASVLVTQADPVTDIDGVVGADYTFSASYDQAWGRAARIIVTNTVAGY